MSLGNEQRLFTKMIGLLIEWAYENGYELTFGDAFRDARVFGASGTKEGYGRASSNHKRRLAVDFNLFKDGIYLNKTEDHQPLGEYWESLGGSWGGRFDDGNHYSLEYQGHR
ncbi:MAG: M15 family metallopeptidase [Nitrosomonadaceae bacterium]